MRKFVAAALLVCIATVMASVSAMAQAEDVLVIPYIWDPATTVYSDQNIVLGAGWGTCRRGQALGFLTATNISWSLEGGTIDQASGDTNNYWGAPYLRPVMLPGELCLGDPIENGWWTDWRYQLGQLPAGVYTLHFSWWLDHPVIDGADLDGDGRPDVYEGIVVEVETDIQVLDR